MVTWPSFDLSGSLGLLEASVTFQTRDCPVDLLVRKKYFHARRKPGDGRTFRAEGFKRGKAGGGVFRFSFEIGGFRELTFGTVDLSLTIFDCSHCRGAALIQRAEKKREVNVEQNNEAHHAEGEFLYLILV